MTIRQIHKALGLLMIAPLFLWAFTGFVFLVKPGYGLAYERLSPTLYPFDKPVELAGTSNWSQIKLLKTVLGYHLLVLEAGQWKHLDVQTLEPRGKPSPSEIEALVVDAIAGREDRYGAVASVDGLSIRTDTDVAIELDWNTLSFAQKGPDTRLIDTLYQIHYLQWLGSDGLNKYFGVIGLVLLLGLTVFGTAMFANGRQRES